MLKNTYLLAISLLCVSSIFSQENIGIANSNYSPTSSVLLNPSSIGDSKVLWEVNLVGISAFVDNNYIFLPKNQFSLPSAIRDPASIPDPLDKFTSSDKNGYLDASIHGPSVVFNVGKHAFGFNTQIRTVLDARNVPFNLSKFIFEGFKYLPQRGIEYDGSNIKINTMSWAEVGINYAYIFKQRKNEQYIGGVSLKRLIGITHGGANIKDVSYSVPDTSDINFTNLDAKYGFTAPAFNSGSGWSLDLGFTYKKTLDFIDHYVPYSRNSNCRKSDYKYKLGVSLLDLGWINFNSGAFYGEIDNDSGIWRDYSDTDFGEADENDARIRESFPNIENQQNSYRAFLPTALSIQYDYNFENGFYLNGTVVQNLSFFNQLGVNRQNLLAITPRLELPRFEVSLPVSLRRYTSPSLGLAVRLWNNIIIGTDRLGPLLFNVDVYGMDIYFSLKIAKLYTSKCKNKRKPGAKKSYKTNDCYFENE